MKGQIKESHEGVINLSKTEFHANKQKGENARTKGQIELE